MPSEIDHRGRLIKGTERTCVHRSSNGAYYSGRFLSDWDIGSVPNGGYSLGTVVHCAKDFVDGLVASNASSSSSGTTPSFSLLHAGAAYLVAVTSTKEWHVEVTLLKRGRAYINLNCVLKQTSRKGDSNELVACQHVNMIFANFAATHVDTPGSHVFVVDPKSPFAFKSPLRSPPPPRSQCKPWFRSSQWPVQSTDEAAIRFERDERGRLFWAGYMYMPEEDEDIVARQGKAAIARYNHALICMLADMAGTPQHMLPPNEKDDGIKRFWFPTLYLAIEIKHPLPSDFALTRVGATACTNEIRPGQWSYDIDIWSHPDDAKRLQLPAGVESVRLAMARQVASMLDFSINQRFVKPAEGGAAKSETSSKL